MPSASQKFESYRVTVNVCYFVDGLALAPHFSFHVGNPDSDYWVEFIVSFKQKAVVLTSILADKTFKHYILNYSTIFPNFNHVNLYVTATANCSCDANALNSLQSFIIWVTKVA